MRAHIAAVADQNSEVTTKNKLSKIKRMKRQRRLETFFQSQREELTFFHVDWSASRPRAVWLSDRPLETNFQEEVQWREMKQFVTIGWSATALIKETIDQANLDTALTAIVKSNLQSVRWRRQNYLFRQI
jgi:hypothetical protein